MSLEQLTFDFGEVEVVAMRCDCEQIRTAVLGEFPNSCGVYVCPPDEVFEWKNKRDSLTIGLLQLENGLHLNSFDFFVGNSGLSFGFCSRGDVFGSREHAILSAVDTLHNCGIFISEISDSVKKSLGKFVDGLVLKG